MIGLGRCDGVAFGAGCHRRRDSHAHSESWRFPRTKSRVRRRYPLRGRSRCDNSSHGDLPTVSPPSSLYGARKVGRVLRSEDAHGETEKFREKWEPRLRQRQAETNRYCRTANLEKIRAALVERI